MENKGKKLWKVSLILSIIASCVMILYLSIGAEALHLIYVPQEDFEALALLVLLPLLLILGLATIVISIISMITTIKCIKVKYRKKTSILFLVIDSLLIFLVFVIIGLMYLNNIK